jgi:hypothetical protein
MAIEKTLTGSTGNLKNLREKTSRITIGMQQKAG